ncbi:MAG: PAQR family membrane homeostasis protein TrhA [Candidatus Heteroscillospira sp.]|jgi:hemolysin III
MTRTAVCRPQTMGEELANAISHGSGVVLAIAGTAVMLYLAGMQAQGVVGAAIYGLSLTVLYAASCVYHAVRGRELKRKLRVLDHCSIFLLIAGTYAPITLVALRDSIGIPLFAVIAACSVLGIVCNLISLERFKKLSMTLYVVEGWMALLAIRPLLAVSTVPQIWLLVGGGICYTVGIIFYTMNKTRYMHFIWHLFVLAGSILHYFYVIQTCYLA